jgi:hypothetical protein
MVTGCDFVIYKKIKNGLSDQAVINRRGHPPKEIVAETGIKDAPLLLLVLSYLALAFFRVICCFSAASRTGKATLTISAATCKPRSEAIFCLKSVEIS